MFYPLSDSAVTVRLGEQMNLAAHHRVKQLFEELSTNPLLGMVELVPSYTTLTVYYDPLQLAPLVQSAQSEYRVLSEYRVISEYQEKSVYDYVCEMLRSRLSALGLMDMTEKALSEGAPVSEGAEVSDGAEVSEGASVIDIPVCYDPEFAPDLAFVAAHNGLEVDEVREIHASASYVVSMLGFLPGFPYFGGMSARIAAPRKATPSVIAPGSVGIAGQQTGIYPIQSPGGWRIIGRTPLKLFDPMRHEPCLLQFGDRVRFYPISKQQFEQWEDGLT